MASEEGRIAFEGRLDDAHRGILSLIPPGLVDMSDIAGTRARAAAMLKAAAGRHAPVAGVALEDAVVPGEGDRPDLPIRIYVPDGVARPAPVLLFIHGGGFVLGDIAQFDMQCLQLAADGGAVVASIEYRCAPESPHPGPVHDCLAALEWLHAVAAERGLDPARIGVGGPSAGAGLAAGLALLARDRGGPAIAFQLLEAPMLDHRGAGQSIDHPCVWNSGVNDGAWAAYLGADHRDGRTVEPYASPTLAEDLSELPPAYLCVAAHDLFVDEAFDYAQRLLRAGVPTEFHTYEMGFHGSPRVLPAAEVSQRWKRDLAAALRRLANVKDSA